ncbi:MAG: GNAT family N-acetyltransferase [Propionibacteriaceae bacterium]|nr:GNAT family N-acetyltransferase [Propionibacteriaceae bacterium]
MSVETQAFTGGWSDQSWSDEIRNHVVLLASIASIQQGADVPVGVLALSMVAGTAEVLRIIVVPEARRRTVGRVLLEYGICEMVQQGASEVFLEVSAENQAAIGLYENFGFAQIDRRTSYYGPGDDALVYRWTTTPTNCPSLDGEGPTLSTTRRSDHV